MAFIVAGSPTAAWGIRDSSAAVPSPRHPRTAAAFTPLCCAGQANGNHDDDYSQQDGGGANGHQLLWVDLTHAECTSSTVPLLTHYLGLDPADDMFPMLCQVGPPALLPALHTQVNFYKLAAAASPSCAAVPVPRCRRPAHSCTFHVHPPSTFLGDPGLVKHARAAPIPSNREIKTTFRLTLGSAMWPEAAQSAPRFMLTTTV